MQRCDWIDYSRREQWLIKLYEAEQLAADDISRLKGVVPDDHLDRLEPGDDFTLYLINNQEEGIRGLFSFWTEIGIAGMNFGSATVWGHFDRGNELLLTEEIAKALDSYGNCVTGTVAYNLYGVRGIFANGSFFTLFPLPDLAEERRAA